METRLLAWMRQLASALSYIHSRGIIHRDVKPSNVFLQLPPGEDLTNCDKADVRLGDFGVAKVAPKQGKPLTMTLVGTPAYLAPEQLFTGDYGAPVDIWGFGIVCHEIASACAAGVFLFEQTWMLGARVSKTPVEPQELPEAWPWGVRQVVSACLSELPEQRPSASQVLHTLSSSSPRAEHTTRANAGLPPAAGSKIPADARRDEHDQSKTGGNVTWLDEVSTLAWLPQPGAASSSDSRPDSVGATLSALALVPAWLSEEAASAIGKHVTQVVE